MAEHGSMLVLTHRDDGEPLAVFDADALANGTNDNTSMAVKPLATLQPAAFGAAVVFGPHVWNFAEIYAALDTAHGAELITDVGKLAVIATVRTALNYFLAHDLQDAIEMNQPTE